MYKNFDSLFGRIIARFVSWELFDEEEVVLAGLALKMIANSSQIVNLCQQRNIKSLISIYTTDHMITSAKVVITETFFIITKNIGLRKLFLWRDLLQILMQNSLRIIDEQ